MRDQRAFRAHPRVKIWAISPVPIEGMPADANSENERTPRSFGEAGKISKRSLRPQNICSL